jgi:hypothetical protein
MLDTTAIDFVADPMAYEKVKEHILQNYPSGIHRFVL